MKKIVFLAAAVAFIAGLLVISTDAQANKYNKMRYQPPKQESSDIYSAENNRSMTDCMQYAANFKSRGMKKDKADFNKQYGAPMSQANRTCTYSYDKYTNIILDCSRGCFAKCMSK